MGENVRAWPEEVPAEANQGAEPGKESSTDADKDMFVSDKLLAGAQKTVEEATAHAFLAIDKAIASQALKDELGPKPVDAMGLLAAYAKEVPSDTKLRLVCYMATDTIKLALSEMRATATKAGQKFNKDDGKELKELLKVVSKATGGLADAMFKASAAGAVAKAVRAGGNTADALARWFSKAKDFAGRRVVPGMMSAFLWVMKAMTPKKGNTNHQNKSIAGEGEGEGEGEEEEGEGEE